MVICSVTGPVSVPVLLSIGIGIASSKRNQQPNSGFGMVTVASLCPVITTQLLSILLVNARSLNEVRQTNANYYSLNSGASTSGADSSGVRELVYGLRAILPLSAALILLLFALKMPWPHISWQQLVSASAAPAAQATGSVEAENQNTPKTSSHSHCEGESTLLPLSRYFAFRKLTSRSNFTISDGESPTTVSEPKLDPRSVAISSNFVSLSSTPASPRDLETIGRERDSRISRCIGYLPLYLFFTTVGIILFNIGLDFGFIPLGSLVGEKLPSTFLSRFPRSSGLAIVATFVLTLGLLATYAEPALYVFAREVESELGIKASPLRFSIAVGVSLGMVFGLATLTFSIPMAPTMIISHFIISLSVFLDDRIVNVAWDSAGITTGPVTVPFLLSIGVGFGNALGGNGFGLISCACVGAVVGVLVGEMMRKTLPRHA